ncbi:MAG TPA: queuosine precursor transporter [Desulfobacteria bacterium]|nr:queuosine precursor transporter [Desulfobacteria bacterium]
MIEFILIWIVLTLAGASIIAALGEKYGTGLTIGIFVGLVVMAQILANKIVLFGTFTLPAGVIVYATSFLVTDILCEFYGKKKALEAVWGGFLASILLVLAVKVAIAWPPAPFWTGQEAFQSTLQLTERIVLGSLVAYVISQNWDVRVFHKLKEMTGGRHLWLRNNVSTMTSQALDTVIFITIAFYGVLPVVPLIVGQYIVKLLIAALDTPFIYGVHWARRTFSSAPL